MTADDPDGHRLSGLDALRGIAACIVAFGFHAQYLFAPGTFAPGWGGTAGTWLHTRGWTAVDLFFVLSGFVFAHAYLRSDGLVTGNGQRRFWIARFARLYPLHLAMLLVTAWLFRDDPANSSAAFAAQLIFAQSLVASVGHTFDGPTWSLSVEMLCYAVFAIAASRGQRALMGVTVAAVGGGLAAIALVGVTDQLTIFSVVARGLLGFFTGQLLWRCRLRFRAVPVAALMLVAIAGLWLGMRGPAGPILPLTLIAWPALLLLSLRLRVLSARPLLWLGERSYAIYLLHMPLIDLVAFSTGGLRGGGWIVAAAHAGLAVVTLAAADLVYRRFELPARATIRKLSSGTPSRASLPA